MIGRQDIQVYVPLTADHSVRSCHFGAGVKGDAAGRRQVVQGVQLSIGLMPKYYAGMAGSGAAWQHRDIPCVYSTSAESAEGGGPKAFDSDMLDLLVLFLQESDSFKVIGRQIFARAAEEYVRVLVAVQCFRLLSSISLSSPFPGNFRTAILVRLHASSS